MFRTLVATSSLALVMMGSALAQDYKVGDLIVDHPVLRATAPGAKVSGGYLVIVNNGKTDDTLVSGTVDFAKKTEVHEMKMEGEVMKMMALPKGLPIPAGETVALKPGGYHLMFMGLKEPMKVGDKHKATLTFEKAGTVEVTFKVKSIAETMKMKMDMKHGSDG